MIELSGNDLVFAFPGVHALAALRVTFMRTQRQPDDGVEHMLPDQGLCILRPVPAGESSAAKHTTDVHAAQPSVSFVTQLAPTEAVWLGFTSPGEYPFCVNVSFERRNAVTGAAAGQVSRGFHSDPQDYVVAPAQSWLGGYRGPDGVMRQFTAHERDTTLRIEVRPLKHDVYARIARERPSDFAPPASPVCYSPMFDSAFQRGSPRQEIFPDPWRQEDWSGEAAVASVRLVRAG